MTKVYLVPKPGMKVRNPIGGYLEAEGEAITMNTYWRRRVAEGGCAPGEKPTAPVKNPEVQVETLLEPQPGTETPSVESATPAVEAGLPVTESSEAPPKTRSSKRAESGK